MYMSMSLTLAVTPGLITDALTESYDGTGAKLQCSNYAPNDKPSACTEVRTVPVHVHRTGDRQ